MGFILAKVTPFVKASSPAFVALDISGGKTMTIFQKLRLIFRCFRLAGPFGLIAGVKYCMGLLAIDETTL